MAMKELQYQIDRIINESTIRRRVLTLVTALSILITFIVPYIAIKPGVAQGSDYKHNFTENDLQSEIFTFTNCTLGTAATPITYDSNTYSKYLDFNKDECVIEFYAPSNGKLVFYHDRSLGRTQRIKLNSKEENPANKVALVDGSLYKSEWSISAGENTVEKKEGFKFYYMEFIPDEPLADIKIGQVYEFGVNSNNKNDYKLAVDDTPKLIQSKEATKTHFEFEASDETGYYYIKNLETGKYLTIRDDNPERGDLIYLDEKQNDLDRQKFKIVADDNNTVNFVTKYEYEAGDPLVINATHSTDQDKINKVSLYNANDNTVANKRFTLIESSYTPSETPPTEDDGVLLDTGFYTIKNKWSEKYLSYGNANIVQVDDVSGNSCKFKFEKVNGEEGYYYIQVLADGLTNNYLEAYYSDENDRGLKVTVQAANNARQKFKLTKNANGTYTIECTGGAIDVNNDGIGVSTWTLNTNNEEQQFVIAETNYTPIEEGNVRIEARVIFGDYNDDGVHTFDNVTPNPEFNLYSLDDGKNELRGKNESNVVIDTSNARKDWCYQYNYYWDVAPIDDEGNNSDSGYYIELTGYETGTSNDGIPTVKIGDEWYKVYYLRDDFLGHPGNNNVIAPTNGKKDNGANAEYNSDPSKTFRNDSGAIYIYLDPLTDWQWNKETHPGTVDIRMKKRWDGHNAGGVDIRPKEKIKVQLQRWNGNQWVEYTNNYNNENYYNWCYYEVTDAAGNKHFVNKSAAKGVLNIYSIPYSDDYQNKGGTVTIDADSLKYENLVADQLDPVNTDDRIKLYLDETKWNNIVLTLDGDNHPQHFDEGYYYKWNNLPYGQYRVVETQSFYDEDGDNVLDESKGDRNTASEYYYMSFPPSRDSSGVLHIQNFTKDMVIEVQKEWYDDQGKTKIDKNKKTVHFNVYRSTAMLKNPTVAQLGAPIYEDVITDATGHLVMKTTDGYPELKLKDENDRKYYYYIQEVSVEGVNADEYTLKNGNSEGFVRSTNGNYYIDYEGGDARKFFIQNKVKVGITLEKEWYTDKNMSQEMTFAEGSEPNAEFEVYVADRFGTPLYDKGEYKVNYEYYTGNNTTGKSTQALTHIADAKIDETGKLEIIGGDINDGNGTSKVMSNQLHIYGTEEVFNGTKTFVADATTKGVFEPQNDWNKTNDYYELPGGVNNRLYVKPRHGFGGILELTFEKVKDTDHIRWFDGNNKYLNEFDDYESGKDLVVTYAMNDGDNKYICRTGVDGTTIPRLKSAVFYPYNYYYIREKNSDTCELINGDDNGFVVLQDTDKYYLNFQSQDNKPCIHNVTAKNTPKKTELDINKEWYSAGTDGKFLTLSKKATFEIYKGYQQGKPTKNGYNYIVNSETLTKLTAIEGLTYDNGFTTDSNGELNVTNLPAYEKVGDKYKKVYYYVREVDGDYELITEGATNGFIADGAGNYGSFLDESDISTTEKAKTYTFKNVPQLKLQVEKKWAQNNTTDNEVKVHLYRSTDHSVANKERSGMKTSAPTAQTTLNETDIATPTTLSAGLYRAGTLNRMLAKVESDESITTLGQAISNEEVPVVYNAVNTLADDNIDSYYVETLTIKSTDSWMCTKTLPVYDDNGNLYYYWAVEDADSAAGYNVDYSFSDNDGNTSNCINADNLGGGIIQVINSLDVIVILPETGGSGTHSYTVTGGAVLLLSAAVLLLKRRKKTV